MSYRQSKDCDCQQNSSFIFGLIVGLIIAAVVAIVIYKNNREDVFLKLKKQIEKFINSLKPKSEKIIESVITPDVPRKKIIKNKKKDVIIPKNLLIADTTPKSTFSKPRKMFKK
ncbi:MAG: hypothetical protein PHR98_00845 [Candidatus Shapirobacteria bacterium]|nr:hypothetical protein [Candidatus Shapirobacteria bacterium]